MLERARSACRCKPGEQRRQVWAMVATVVQTVRDPVRNGTGSTAGEFVTAGKPGS